MLELVLHTVRTALTGESAVVRIVFMLCYLRQKSKTLLKTSDSDILSALDAFRKGIPELQDAAIEAAIATLVVRSITTDEDLIDFRKYIGQEAETYDKAKKADTPKKEIKEAERIEIQFTPPAKSMAYLKDFEAKRLPLVGIEIGDRLSDEVIESPDPRDRLSFVAMNHERGPVFYVKGVRQGSFDEIKTSKPTKSLFDTHEVKFLDKIYVVQVLPH